MSFNFDFRHASTFEAGASGRRLSSPPPAHQLSPHAQTPPSIASYHSFPPPPAHQTPYIHAHNPFLDLQASCNLTLLANVIACLDRETGRARQTPTATATASILKKPLKRHACSLCSLSFAKLDNLRQHVKNVHEKIREHKCGSCEYSSSKRSNVRTHENSKHLKNKSWVCPECDYMATRRDHLAKHVSRMHKKKKKEAVDNGGRTHG